MTRSDLRTITAKKLEEDLTQALRWYTDLQIANALNDALVVYASLTMCVESTFTLNATEGNSFYDLFSLEPRTIAVLRVTESGARLTPDRIESFGSRNNAWRLNYGLPEQFAVVGSNLFCVAPPPPAIGITLAVTVAKVADAMLFDGSTPVIPAEDHFSLAEYAAWFLATCREGASEKANQCIARFFERVSVRIDQVRDRGKSLNYGMIPPPLDKARIQAIIGGASERRNRRQ